MSKLLSISHNFSEIHIRFSKTGNPINKIKTLYF